MTIPLDHVRAHYDSVPYASHAYTHSSPDQLAAVAYLFGLSSPPVACARVLELGGSSGGNLIPLAVRHPQLQAVGLDLSGVQIDLGRHKVERLGLNNVSLLQADLAEVDAQALGQFDYIICHGLYSWVPPHVQEAMLRICSSNLAPQGVAYVSYNTYPGWKSKEMIRDAMLLHGSSREKPDEQIAYARGMVGFLQQVARKDSMLAKALEENLPYIRNAENHYLAHEYLEPYNLPCYFNQFLERAAGHGLSYLGEAQPAMMVPANYGSDVAEPLVRAFGHDQAKMEQYLDFAINRGFRQTLLVHASRAPEIRHHLDRVRLRTLHYAASLPCTTGVTRLDGSVQEYGVRGQSSISTSTSCVKQALDLLTEAWPATLERNELVERVGASSDPAVRVSREILESAIDELLEYLVVRGMARIRLTAVRMSVWSAGNPRIDPAVRRMTAVLEGEDMFVANAWHESVELSLLERKLFPHMDGALDRSGLIQVLVESAASGGGDSKPASMQIDTMMQRLRHMAVLEGDPVSSPD